MVRYEASSLLIRFTETLGDKIGVEFRHGKDGRGRVYATNTLARGAVFETLNQMEKDIEAFCRLLENSGRERLQRDLQYLLNVPERKEGEE